MRSGADPARSEYLRPSPRTSCPRRGALRDLHRLNLMRRAASLLFLLSAVVACDGTAPGDSVPQWTLVEDLRIGGADTGAASFSGITALRFGPSGRLWLVEAQ